ncbi:hypothetical protein D3C73_1628780 [compost metagenome]
MGVLAGFLELGVELLTDGTTASWAVRPFEAQPCIAGFQIYEAATVGVGGQVIAAGLCPFLEGERQFQVGQ